MFFLFFSFHIIIITWFFFSSIHKYAHIHFCHSLLPTLSEFKYKLYDLYRCVFYWRKFQRILTKKTIPINIYDTKSNEMKEKYNKKYPVEWLQPKIMWFCVVKSPCINCLRKKKKNNVTKKKLKEKKIMLKIK